MDLRVSSVHLGERTYPDSKTGGTVATAGTEETEETSTHLLIKPLKWYSNFIAPGKSHR